MTKPKEHHVVTFYSPGTLVSETSERDVPAWDTVLAAEIARGILERHGARPYGFRFRTELRAQEIDDGYGGKMQVVPKTVRESGTHFIEARLMTLEDVKRERPDDRTLISNMGGNGIARVAFTQNGYSHCAPFESGDRVVDKNGIDVTP